MAKGPDTGERHDPPLSAKAREIKKQIDEGRYDIDLPALADALVDAGALERTALDETDPSLAHSDQKPGKD